MIKSSHTNMAVSDGPVVPVHNASLGRMHFDVERGEAIVVVRSFEGGETEASVGKEGELRYEEGVKTVSVKNRRKVYFRRVGNKTGHEPENLSLDRARWASGGV